MGTVVGRSRIYDQELPLKTGGPALTLAPFQPFVFVSLANMGQGKRDATHYFPAVVDTGYGGLFCLRWEHLTQFVGVHERIAFRLVAGVQVVGSRAMPKIEINRYGAFCHIEGNLLLWDRQRRRPERHPSRCRVLELNRDIVVYLPPSVALELCGQAAIRPRVVNLALQPDMRPRCPLLGVRALREHGLCLTTTGHWFTIEQRGIVARTWDRLINGLEEPLPEAQP